MLTVLVGDNTQKRAARLAALTLFAQKKGADVRAYTDVNFDAGALRAMAQGSSLFGGAQMATISGVADNTLVRDELETLLPLLGDAEAQFVISETKLPAAFMKAARAAKAEVEEFENKQKVKKEEAFNIFAWTDAFSARNRSLTWALYRKAIALGLEPRELAGKLFWSTKTILLAEQTATAEESGLHSFVYGKAKQSAKNFAPGELAAFSYELTTLFHEALASGNDLEVGLESLILRRLAK